MSVNCAVFGGFLDPISSFQASDSFHFVILGFFVVKNDDWEQVLQAEGPSDRQKPYRGDTDEKKNRNGFGVRGNEERGDAALLGYR